MIFKIENCNNIKLAEIEINQKKKTIIVAKNGTGKSTISRSILKHIQKENLDDFNSQCTYINGEPKVSGDVIPKTIMHYDENYSNDFIFGENDILESEKSYLLIQVDDSVRSKIDEVSEIISKFKGIVNESLLPNSKTFKEAVAIRNFNHKKEFVLSSKYKNLKEKNPLMNREIMRGFFTIVKSIDSKIDWYSWRSKYQVIENDSIHVCPYCSQIINQSLLETLNTLSKDINIGAVKSREELKRVKTALTLISNYDLEVFDSITDGIASIDSKINQEKLRVLTEKIFKLQKTVEQISKINSDDFLYLGFDLSEIKISTLDGLKDYEQIKREFDNLKVVSSQLSRKIDNINKNLVKALTSNAEILNEFCRSTGIPYVFHVEKILNRERIILKYIAKNIRVTNPKHRLSYGEKNALATMFFGIMAKQQKVEMIVFDDPFSSFDEHKRYFLYNQLFGKGGLLKGKTIVYFTHDIEPVYDLIYLGKPTTFDFCYSISNNLGIINVDPITKKDITNYRTHLVTSINSSKNIIVRLVYVRKVVEVFEKYTRSSRASNYYYLYQFISSYLKGGRIQEKIDRDEFIDMSDDNIKKAQNQLKNLLSKYEIDNFNVDANLVSIENVLGDFEELNLIEEKLIFMRYLLNVDLNTKRLVVDNNQDLSSYFLNSMHHFEKERMLIIDKHKYTDIPSFVNTICDSIFYELKLKYSQEAA